MYYTHRLFAEVDGNWGEWGAWGSCSRTCGNGTWIRSRSCNNPIPAHGGSGCPGDKHDRSQCSKRECPGIYVIIKIKRLLFLPSSVLVSFVPSMNSNSTHCEVYSIQHHVINYISELW